MVYKLLRLPAFDYGGQIVEAFGDDKKEYILCPNCESEIKLSHYKDSKGFHVKPDIRCSNCGSEWAILLR